MTDAERTRDAAAGHAVVGAADGTEDRTMAAFAAAIGAWLRGGVSVELRDRQADAAAAAAATSRATARRWLGVGRLGPLALAAGLLGVAVLGGIGTLGRDPLPLIAIGAAGGPAAMSAPAPAAGPAMERGAGADAGDMTRPADVPSDLSLWRPTVFRFVLADGVRADADRGEAWAFEAPAGVARIAADLASLLGLPAPGPSEWDVRTLVSQGADGAMLSVQPTGEWYFSGPSDGWPQWTCRPSAAGDGSEQCAPPAPAVGLPSDAEAERLALDLLARTGVTGARRTDVFRDDWTVSVAGEIPLPGGPSGLGSGVWVTFGAQGRLLSVSATLARPVALGRYPTVDVAAAVARLQADMDAPMQAMPLPAIEPGVGPAVEPAPPVAPGAAAPSGQEPEVVEVRIVGAELTASWAWTPDGRMLVVPHYRLRDADGGEWWVIAVEDRFLQR
jgi:hypothetical protein